MKKIIIALLSTVFCVCGTVATAVSFAEEDAPVSVYTAQEFITMNGNGNYVLENDIVLGAGEYGPAFSGTFDGQGHTITVNGAPAAFRALGGGSENSPVKATVKNFTVAGTITGTGRVAGVSTSAVGTIENVKVTADISSTANQGIAGIASCNGKNPLVVKDCVFEGTVTLSQGFTSASNYSYWGMFLGYNGGALGGGKVENSVARYTFVLPAADDAEISDIEFFNTNGDSTDSVKNSFTKKTEGGNAVYTFDCVVNMDPVSLASVNDEGIMANYGTPVVRFTLKDGSYRYIDGYDRAAGRYVTAFDYSAGGFGGMYKYKDISYLVLKETGRHTEGGEIEGQAGSVTSTYSELTVNTAEEFESFARIINSAIPAVFKDENGETVTRSILDTLTISVKLGADIDLTQGDANGNASEFYGIGKQEFFPYRGGIDGDGHKIKLNIDAPNGYCVGIISVVSEMSEDIFVKNLIVEGSIKGKTKVGIVGYFDMVCNAYVKGGTLRFDNVKNYADISGFTAVGGLLGCVSADKDEIKTYVENCENYGDITLAAGGRYAGGMIGIAGFYASHGTGVQINGAANKGGITLGAGTKYAGGIAGMIYDNISSLENVSSTAAIAVSSAACTGNLLGYSGAVKMTATDGDIGKYAVSPAANVIAVTFRDAETVSDYGTSVTIKLNDANITPNYDLRLTFTDGNGDKYTFADGKTERSKNALGSYTVIMEPGVYTMGITAYNGEEYYSDGQIEDGTVLAATASFTVNKKALNYTFNDVSVAYTGSPVTYFEALETLPGYDKTAHAIPDTSVDNGAAWEIKYYKDGIETGAPADFGVYDVTYDVTARLIANGKFSSRYEFEDRTYEVKMTVTKPLLTVTVNNVEINKGGKATFGVSVKTSDGSEFSDIAALRLVYRVKGYGTDDTSILPFGTYTVEANGSAPALYDVEYKTGTLIVKNVSQTSENNSGKKTKKGCKGDLGAVCSLGIAALAAAVALKRKK